MQILKIRMISEWKQKYSDSRTSLDTWASTVRTGEWKTPHEMKNVFNRSISIISTKKEAQMDEGMKRIVFNISGNKYRLVAHVTFSIGVLEPMWFGPHAEYDKINLETKVWR